LLKETAGMTRLIASMIISSIATVCHAASTPKTVPATSNASNCKLTVPVTWGAKSVSWLGACRNQKAEGSGIARVLNNGKVSVLYFGTARNGLLSAGIVEFLGKEKNGTASSFDLVPAKEIILKTTTGEETGGVIQFINAYNAINATADKFEKAGNKPSADYYRAKSNYISLYFGE
jgi:hypothetical protein